MRTRRAAIDPREADVLRRRAAQLARPLAVPDTGAAGVPALAFDIAGQACVLPLAWVREVRAPGELLALPLARAPVLGVVQLRGRMLPVVDARELLDTAGPAGTPRALLVIGRKTPELAFAVNEIHGLRQLAADEAERRAGALESVRPELVRGTTAAGELLLDGERLLALHRGPGS